MKWKNVFLPPRAPSSIFTFEFLNNDDIAVKFRVSSLQPTGHIQKENL